MRLFSLILLLLLPIAAHAEPVTAFLAIVLIPGTAITIGSVLLMIGSAVYGTAMQRKAARKSKDAYNKSLQERTITSIASENPFVYVYGRARVGSSVVAMFTSGEKDEYKHLVCIHAAHECDAIEEVYVAGYALGDLDADGYPLSCHFSGELEKSATEYLNVVGGKATLSHEPSAGTLRVTVDRESIGFTQSGNVVTITAPDIDSVKCTYRYKTNTTAVRVQKHLGIASDPADAYLRGLFPDKWPASAVLRGFCYTVITLDLNQSEFQGGIPAVEVLVRGKKLFDPRRGITAWSQNNALVAYDYLTGEVCGVPKSDIPLAQLITAANTCDDLTPVGKRYTFNGVVTSDDPQSASLEKIAQSMAGGIVATTWEIWAGKWIAPVAALDQSDIVGELSIVPGVSVAELFNGVRGQYVGAESGWVATDITPYQNITFAASDGKDLWTDIEFGFTDEIQRCWNLARIFVEDQRHSFTLKAEFGLTAWPVKVGQRVAMSSAFFGWESKIFRVTDKSYSPTTAITLTLKEDFEAIWDFSDEVMSPVNTGTDVVNPYYVPTIEYLTCTSGVGVLFVQSDGTIINRILVEWPPVNSVSADTIEVEWQKEGDDVWQQISVTGDATQAYLSPVEDQASYTIRARTVSTAYNARSIWTYTDHTVNANSAVPANALQFVARGGMFSIYLSWVYPPESDVAKIEIWGAPIDDFATVSHLVDVAYPSTTWTHSGLELGQFVYYWARIVNTSGVPSEWVTAVGQANASVAEIIDALEGQITESQLYADLRAKIEILDPSQFDEVRSSLGLLEELNGITLSAVKQISSARTVGATSEAERLGGMIATTQAGLEAEILNVQRVFADETEAVATQLDWMQATVSDPETGLAKAHAAIKTEQTARATADSAIASSVSTLQSTVGGQTTSIQTLQSVTNGISGEYYVKIDSNGNAAGFGLANGPSGSMFVVAADKFAIATTGSNAQAPFIVTTTTTYIGGVAIPPGTYIRSAYIQNATIDTLKIKGNAVTVPMVSVGSDLVGNGGWQVAASGVITLDYSGVVFAGSGGYIGYGSGWTFVETELYINGVMVASGQGAEAYVSSVHYGALACNAGRVSVVLKYKSGPQSRIYKPLVTIQGAMR